MTTKTKRIRKGQIGVCPTCKSQDYRRHIEDVIVDEIIHKCVCSNCNGEWWETFRLVEQEWEEL